MLDPYLYLCVIPLQVSFTAFPQPVVVDKYSMLELYSTVLQINMFVCLFCITFRVKTKTYAALDAYVSRQPYVCFGELSDPMFGDAEERQAGV